MFLRIRGKGACPENSQAALLHLRGFRHVQCPPPAGAAVLATVDAGEQGDAMPTVATNAQPFLFPHFAMGVHAPSVPQHQLETLTRSGKDSGMAVAAGGKAEQQQQQQRASTLLPMVWKEVWNIYDICYDDVPLLPPEFHTTDELLKELVSSRAGAGADGGPLLHPAPPSNFSLPSHLTGNAKTIVCTHYCSGGVWPPEAFNDMSAPTPAATATADVASAAAPSLGSAIVVVDLSDLPPENCGSRLAISLAWALGFASLQEDNVLLRTAGVVVRLPYTVIPQLSPCKTRDESGGSVILSAFLEMRDFLSQHIQLVITACHRAVRDLDTREGEERQTAKADATVPRPPIVFIGKPPADLTAALQALIASTRATVAASPQPASLSAPVEVAVLQTDEHHSSAPGAVTAADKSDSEGTAMGMMMSALAAASTVAVQVIVAPVRALLDGGEEPWDAYTLKERSRLNYCPCCGNCGITEGQEGSDEGAGHGHHHGHGH